MNGRFVKTLGLVSLFSVPFAASSEAYNESFQVAFGAVSPDEGESRSVFPMSYTRYYKDINTDKGPVAKATLFNTPIYAMVGYQKTIEDEQVDIDTKKYGVQYVFEETGGFVSTHIEKMNKNRLNTFTLGVYDDGHRFALSYSSVHTNGVNGDKDGVEVKYDGFFVNDANGGFGVTAAIATEENTPAYLIGGSYYLNRNLGAEVTISKSEGGDDPVLGFTLQYDITDGYGAAITIESEEAATTSLLSFTARF